MANSLNGNPIIINSAFASYKAAVASVLGTLFVLRVEKIEFKSPAAPGAQATIIDPASGAILASLTAETAGGSQVLDWTPNPKLWRDFGVSNLDSGQLIIWTR